jgi:hypothetical protein
LRALEEAIDLVKTRQGNAKVILVGGGSIIVGDHIAGVAEIIRPKYFEVANAVGAAVCATPEMLCKVLLTLADRKNQRHGRQDRCSKRKNYRNRTRRCQDLSY